MKWIDGLCALWEREHDGQDVQPVRDTERAYFEGRETIAIYRTPMQGGPSYTKGEGLLLALSGGGTAAFANTDASSVNIEAERDFYTVAQMDLELTGKKKLVLRPKKLVLFQNRRWNVDTNMLGDVVRRIIEIVERVEPQYASMIEVVYLLPPKKGKHSIMIRTPKLPHDLTLFSEKTGYRPTDDNGGALSSDEAAVRLMNNLLTMVRQIADVLIEIS